MTPSIFFVEPGYLDMLLWCEHARPLVMLWCVPQFVVCTRAFAGDVAWRMAHCVRADGSLSHLRAPGSPDCAIRAAPGRGSVRALAEDGSGEGRWTLESVCGAATRAA